MKVNDVYKQGESSVKRRRQTLRNEGSVTKPIMIGEEVSLGIQKGTALRAPAMTQIPLSARATKPGRVTAHQQLIQKLDEEEQQMIFDLMRKESENGRPAVEFVGDSASDSEVKQ